MGRKYDRLRGFGLRRYRKKVLKCTATELADYLGLHPNTIHQNEQMKLSMISQKVHDLVKAINPKNFDGWKERRAGRHRTSKEVHLYDENIKNLKWR